MKLEKLKILLNPPYEPGHLFHEDVQRAIMKEKDKHFPAFVSLLEAVIELENEVGHLGNVTPVTLNKLSAAREKVESI